MAKQKPKSEQKRTGQQFSVRCTDEDADLFERAATIEGADSAQRWMVQVCRKRARAILQAAEKGESISVSEVIAVPVEKG